MNELDDKENEEYKKRIRDLVSRVEAYAESNTPEIYQQLLDELERLQESIIRNVQEKYRNAKVIYGFIFLLENYYYLRKDPVFSSREEKFQKQIDFAYRCIYEELKKLNLNRPKYTQMTEEELSEIHKALIYMRRIIGAKKTEQFYNKYKIENLVSLNSPLSKKQLRNSLFIYLSTITIGIIIFVIITLTLKA